MKIHRLGSKKTIIAAVVLVLVVGAGVILHTHSVHKAQSTSGTIPNSKKGSSSSNANDKKTASDQTDSSSAPNKTQEASSPASSDASGTLIAPFGTFVSNHKPGQSGSPTSEQSVCNTTPGASCDIQFTSGGIMKSLGSQTANSNGATYWSWDIKGGTLAPGTWKVTAVVKLNGQTKTTADPMSLEVQ